MVQRSFLLLTIVLLIVSPAFSTEPTSSQNDSIESGKFEEFNYASTEKPAARPRGFARNGQFRGAGFRQGAFRRGPFDETEFEGDFADREVLGFRRHKQLISYETEFGFAYIDGQLVPSPYRIERKKDGAFYLNDIPLEDYAISDLDDADDTVPFDADALYMVLNTDRFAVKFSGRPVVFLDEKTDDLLLTLLLRSKEERSAELASILDRLPAGEDRAQWTQWLLQTEITGRQQERMEQRLQFLQETKDKSARFLNAEAVMDNYSYPLTLLGMIVVVLAVGYLLAFNPSMAQLLPEQMRAAQLSKSVQYSVILIVVMSALDLAWTILSSSVGLMNELNPVGSNLIQDPISLIKFKMAATLLAAGLFIGLRKFRSAQLASWWMCIVCTLVSARWLVFNSLYMG